MRREAKVFLYRLLDRFLDSFFGGRYLNDYLYRKPKKCVRALRRYNDSYAFFSGIVDWPSSVDSFDKLAFLFHSSQANYALCLMAFDEAAYLYRIATGIQKGRLAEIGRFKGGGTFLLAAAMGSGCELDSYDLHRVAELYSGELKTNKRKLDGARLDEEVSATLERYGLRSRVHLLVEDSTRADISGKQYELVLVDGDHSYDGVKRDFLKWFPSVKPGSHMLFHDAARQREFAVGAQGVERLIEELRREKIKDLVWIKTVGSLVHFMKT